MRDAFTGFRLLLGTFRIVLTRRHVHQATAGFRPQSALHYGLRFLMLRATEYDSGQMQRRRSHNHHAITLTLPPTHTHTHTRAQKTLNPETQTRIRTRKSLPKSMRMDASWSEKQVMSPGHVAPSASPHEVRLRPGKCKLHHVPERYGP